MAAIAVALLTLMATPAPAQTAISLVTPDGRVGCVQGMTGIGRPQAWQGIADPDGPGGWVLVETANDATDLRFPLCMLPGAVTRDIEATLRFRIVSGTRERVAGLVLRAQDAANYYVVRASALDGSVKFYRVQNGRRGQLGGKEAPVKAGQWQVLGVKLVADKFEVSLDGAPLFTATDRGLPQPGAIGVWSQADSLTHFGVLTVANPSPR